MYVEHTAYCSECGEDDQGWPLLLYTQLVFHRCTDMVMTMAQLLWQLLATALRRRWRKPLPQPCSRGAVEQSRYPRLILVEYGNGEGDTIAIFTRREECSTV